VSHPDGSGRKIEAKVPFGISPGSTFYVEDNDTHSMIGHTSSVEEDDVVLNYSSVTPLAPLSPPSVPILNNKNCGQNNDKRLVRVTVPPNVQPGTKIHVQVPGENRIIEAQIPANCKEFYVQYDPKPSINTPFSVTLSPPAMLQQHYTYSHNQTMNPTTTNTTYTSSHSQQPKLLLVQVPPGVSAGMMLHVEIPDEPGRILSARVPPGNVRQFHVSYIPNRSTL
jgi:hypothetical protein